MGTSIGYDEVNDYLFIPDNVSMSKKVELLINNPKGHGLIRVIEQASGNRGASTQEGPLSGVTFIKNDEIERYDRTKGTTDGYSGNDFGKIVAFCMSPSKKKICVYRDNGSFFIVSSNFEKLKEKEFGAFQINDFNKRDKEDVNEILRKPLDYQLLFCGDDSLCICGRKYVIVAAGQNKTLNFKLLKKSS